MRHGNLRYKIRAYACIPCARVASPKSRGFARSEPYLLRRQRRRNTIPAKCAGISARLRLSSVYGSSKISIRGCSGLPTCDLGRVGKTDGPQRVFFASFSGRGTHLVEVRERKTNCLMCTIVATEIRSVCLTRSQSAR